MKKDLILLAVSLFIWGIGETSFLSFQPLYLEQLGADPLLIGAIIGGYGAATILAHIPAGYLADRFGRRPVIWAAWVIGLIAAWCMALANSLPTFIIGMLLYGLTMFVMAPLNSYITAARGSLSVGRTVTLISAAYNLGAIFGPLLGGTLGERYGYRTIFTTGAVFFIVSTLIILFLKPQPVEQIPRESNRPALFSNRRYTAFLLILFLASFAMFLPQPLAPNFLQNERGLGLAEIGRLYSAAALGIVGLNLVLGQLEATLGFLLGQIAMGGFAMILWLAPGMPWYYLAFLLIGGYRTARSLSTAHIRSLVDAASMGLAFGVAETIGSAAMLAAPPLAGALYAYRPESVYMVSISLILISLLASLIVTMQKAIHLRTATSAD